VDPQLAVVEPGVFECVIPAGFGPEGVIAVIELAEDAAAEVIGLVVQAGHLFRTKHLVRGGEPAVVSRAHVYPEAPYGASHPEAARRRTDGRGEIQRGVLQPVVCAGRLFRIGAGAVIVDAAVVPVRTEHVQYDAIAPEP